MAHPTKWNAFLPISMAIPVTMHFSAVPPMALEFVCARLRSGAQPALAVTDAPADLHWQPSCQTSPNAVAIPQFDEKKGAFKRMKAKFVPYPLPFSTQMAQYRRPFAEPGEGRRPTLTWPREIPIEGKPADVQAIAIDYADWLGTSNVPKLFLKAEPGAILANERLVGLVRGWPALTEKSVAGIHFVQEDSPDEIGRDVAAWMRTLN